MLRRIRSVSLIALTTLVVSAFTAMPASIFPPDDHYISGGFEYRVFDDERASIEDYHGADTEVTIPAELGGYPVTNIGHNAFESKGLFDVTIPNSVQYISNRAFLGNHLTTITIPDSVEMMGSYVFANNDLRSISYSASNAHLGSGAFMNNELTHVDVPSSVRTIASRAFAENSISSVSIADSVTTIGNSAFEDNLLAHVTIPDSVTTIDSFSFQNNLLTSVDIPNSVTTINNYAFARNQLNHVTIPDSLATIGWGAFSDNELESVDIAGSVSTIGGRAFKGNLLTSIDIPSSVQTIGYAAFEDNQLTSVSIPDSVHTIDGDAFAGNQLDRVTIPNSVTTIGVGAFQFNLLESVEIPNSITTIDTVAFADNLLTSVSIPNSVTTIGPGALSYNQLTAVSIPNSVTAIEDGAFAENQLTSVTLPANLDTLGSYAFRQNQLTSITIPRSVNAIGSNALSYNAITAVTMLGDEPDDIGTSILGDSDPLVTFPHCGYYTPGTPGYWNAGGTEYRANHAPPPPQQSEQGSQDWRSGGSITMYVCGDGDRLYFDSDGNLIGSIPTGAFNWRDDWSGDRKFVALGDSYQSGEGAFIESEDRYVYREETHQPGVNMCHRADTAAASLIHDRMTSYVDPVPVFDFWACSGAEIPEVRSNHTSTENPPWNDPLAPNTGEPNDDLRRSQLDRLGNDSWIVTLGIGGNDIGFADVLGACVLGPSNCIDSKAQEIEDAIEDLRPELAALLSDVRNRAPNATVFVYGYPRFFPEDERERDDCGQAGVSGAKINSAEQQWVNDGIADVNEVVEREATKRGFVYVDIYDVGDGIEICTQPDARDNFMVGLDLMAVPTIFEPARRESFHPNTIGHRLIAQRFFDVVNIPVHFPEPMIHEGETKTFDVRIPDGIESIFSTIWPGSDVQMTLTSPSGVVFTRTALPAGATVDAGNTHEAITVPGAEPGVWTVELYGASIAPGGETLLFQTATQPLPNQAPNAVTAVETEGLSITASSAGSTDPDGTIESLWWDLGDGTTVYSTDVSHTYTDPGNYRVTLVLTDDLGESTYESTTIEVGEDSKTPSNTILPGTTNAADAASSSPEASVSPSPLPESSASAQTTREPSPSPTTDIPPGEPIAAPGEPNPSMFPSSSLLWWIVGASLLAIGGVIAVRRITL